MKLVSNPSPLISQIILPSVVTNSEGLKSPNSSSGVSVPIEEYDSDSSSFEEEPVEISWSKDGLPQSDSPATTACTSVSSTKTIRNNKQRYWKANFIAVFLPFIFCGIPIHLILFGKRGITSTRQWFKSIFFQDHPAIIVLTIIFFLLGLFLNGFFFYVAYTFINSLVVKGQISQTIIEDVINLLRTAPIVIPLDLVWIWGFSIRKLLLSFDRMTYPVVDVDPEKSSFNLRNSIKMPKYSIKSYRARLFGIYILIILYLTVKLLMLVEENKTIMAADNNVDLLRSAVFNKWINFCLNSMYNLMLPVYINFCFAIQFEFSMLSQYIKSLIGLSIHPDFIYLSEIKKYYKQVGNHVMHVNDICNYYFSWVFVVLYASMYNEFIALGSLLLHFLLGKLQLDPVDVRILMGNLFCVVIQNVLLGLAVWFIICANDEARNLHVRLNDFVTQPSVTLSPDLYKSFRMLKYYIHSRMETETPALLNVWSVSLIPCGGCGVYKWMTGYRVRH